MVVKAKRGCPVISNSATVLIVLAKRGNVSLESVAEQVGLSTRGVQVITSALVDEGYVTRRRSGRHLFYAVDRDRTLPGTDHLTIRDVLNRLG